MNQRTSAGSAVSGLRSDWVNLDVLARHFAKGRIIRREPGWAASATATAVMIDSDGRLGTFTVAAADPGGFSPQRVQPQAVPDARQAMLNRKVEKLAS